MKPLPPRALDEPARVRKLLAADRKTAAEVARRRRAETALRKSEHHHQRFLDDAKHMQIQMRDLSRRLLHAREEERRQISRDLHDDVLQTLVGIKG